MAGNARLGRARALDRAVGQPPENTDDYVYRVEGAGGKSRFFGHQAHARRRLTTRTQDWKAGGREGKRPELIATARGSLSPRQQLKLSPTYRKGDDTSRGA